MASGEEAVTEEAVTEEVVDVTEMIPTSIDDVSQLWVSVQDIVAAWGLKVVAAIAIFIIGRWIAKAVRSGR